MRQSKKRWMILEAKATAMAGFWAMWMFVAIWLFYEIMVGGVK